MMLYFIAQGILVIFVSNVHQFRTFRCLRDTSAPAMQGKDVKARVKALADTDG